VDVDDDGDGLLDVYDTERLEPSVESDWLEPVGRLWLASAIVDAPGAAGSAARVGNTLILDGDGFDCANVVSFLGGDVPINVGALSVVGDELRVVVPAGAQGPVAVFGAAVRSNLLPLHVAGDATSPLLSDVAEAVRLGDTLVLRGSGLAGVTSVELHGATLTPESAIAGEVHVVVPDTLPGPGSHAVAFAGLTASNAVAVPVVRPVRASVVLPDTANIEVTTTSGEALLDASNGADVEVGARRVTIVSALRDDVALLEALVLPEDDTIELSPASSATASAFLLTQAWRVVAPTSLALLRERVRALDETAALATAIGAALALSDVRDFEALRAELVAAVNAVQAVIDAGLVDGSLMPISPPSFPIVAAVIDPVEQEGVTVSQIPDTGNVRVDNDTSLFLSTRIEDIELDRPLVYHVQSPFHPNVVKPQSAVFGLSTSVDYAAPNSRDARVQVLTAGAAAPLPIGTAAQNAHTLLALRTITSEVIAPFVNIILDVKVEEKVVVASFIRHAPAEIRQFGNSVRAGDAAMAASALADVVLTETKVLLETPEGGKLIRSILGDLYKNFILDRASKFASRFIPIVGQLKAIYDILDTISNGVQGVRSVLDIIATPAVLDFTVIFGMAVTDLEPDELARGCTGGFLTVVGAGLQPERDAGVVRLPEVTVTDPHPLGPGSMTVTEGHWRIAADGTEIEIALPDAYATTMQGPLEVSVTHRGETLVVPDTITIGGDPALTAVEPAVAAEGEAVAVVGTGLAGPIEVHFVDPRDSTNRAIVTTFTAMSDTRLDLVVPVLPATSSRSWLVHAQQGAGLCTVNSNTVGFATSAGECATAIVMDGAPVDINSSGVIVGQMFSGECFLLAPRDGQYFADDDGDGTTSP